MRKIVLSFALIVFLLLILFQLSNASLFIPSIRADVMIAIGAVILMGLGVFFGRQSPRMPIIDADDTIDTDQIQKLGLTDREMEVLQLISDGFSNQEIGEKLFLSESTIKTHVSNLFVKLDVKRRTQAVTRAKELRVIL